MSCFQATCTILLTAIALSIAFPVLDDHSVSRLIPLFVTHIAQDTSRPFPYVNQFGRLEQSVQQLSNDIEHGASHAFHHLAEKTSLEVSSSGESPAPDEMRRNTSDVSGSSTSTGSSEDVDDSLDTGQSSGLTLDLCRDDRDCLTPRVCISDTEIPVKKCTGDICRCVRLAGGACSSDTDCVKGEGCFTMSDFNVEPIPGLSNVQFCASRAAHEQIGRRVCIGVNSLDHLPKDNLVFEKDVVAHVLCDISHSCATPGHMVIYKGKTMMMKSYCELVGCEGKIMKVNSPRYRRRMKIASHADNMEFIVFSARYETIAEEVILSVAVKLGL